MQISQEIFTAQSDPAGGRGAVIAPHDPQKKIENTATNQTAQEGDDSSLAFQDQNVAFLSFPEIFLQLMNGVKPLISAPNEVPQSIPAEGRGKNTLFSPNLNVNSQIQSEVAQTHLNSMGMGIGFGLPIVKAQPSQGVLGKSQEIVSVTTQTPQSVRAVLGSFFARSAPLELLQMPLLRGELRLSDEAVSPGVLKVSPPIKPPEAQFYLDNYIDVSSVGIPDRSAQVNKEIPVYPISLQALTEKLGQPPSLPPVSSEMWIEKVGHLKSVAPMFQQPFQTGAPITSITLQSKSDDGKSSVTAEFEFPTAELPTENGQVQRYFAAPHATKMPQQSAQKILQDFHAIQSRHVLNVMPLSEKTSAPARSSEAPDGRITDLTAEPDNSGTLSFSSRPTQEIVSGKNTREERGLEKDSGGEGYSPESILPPQGGLSSDHFHSKLESVRRSISHQVNHALDRLNAAGAGKARIRFSDKQMGDVQIVIALNSKKEAQIEIHTQNSILQKNMEENSLDLKKNIEDKKISVSKIEVKKLEVASSAQQSNVQATTTHMGTFNGENSQKQREFGQGFGGHSQYGRESGDEGNRQRTPFHEGGRSRIQSAQKWPVEKGARTNILRGKNGSIRVLA